MCKCLPMSRSDSKLTKQRLGVVENPKRCQQIDRATRGTIGGGECERRKFGQDIRRWLCENPVPPSLRTAESEVKIFPFPPHLSLSLTHTLVLSYHFHRPGPGHGRKRDFKTSDSTLFDGFSFPPARFQIPSTPTDQRKGNRLTAVPTVPTPHPTLNLNKSYHRTRQARRAACRASRGDRAVERSHTAGHSFPIARGPNV